MAQIVENPAAVQETQFDPWVRKIPWRREWPPTPVFLPGEFHGQSSLGDYCSWGHKESDGTEQLTFSLSLKLYSLKALDVSFLSAENGSLS